MDMLVIIYAICALRTNLVFFAVFITLIFVFSLLSAAYWRLGMGDLAAGHKLTIVGSLFLFQRPTCVVTLAN
jgi:uncharacterized protein